MESEKLFSSFLSANEKIETIIRENWIVIDDYIINDDETIDVMGNVLFPKVMGFLKELPLKFNYVSGNFDCSWLKLSTLKGSPIEVGGYFNCSFNPLVSLEYAPIKVGKTFLFDNTIKSLFTDGKNSDFNKVEMLMITNVPESITLPDLILENEIHLTLILKYQNKYKIWNSDKTLNEENMKILIQNIIIGLE